MEFYVSKIIKIICPIIIVVVVVHVYGQNVKVEMERYRTVILSVVM
jgi:hypothetical protein